MRYPATATLSEAVKEVIDTANDLDVAGAVKAETVGADVSTVTDADLLVETLPAASLAQA